MLNYKWNFHTIFCINGLWEYFVYYNSINIETVECISLNCPHITTTSLLKLSSACHWTVLTLQQHQYWNCPVHVTELSSHCNNINTETVQCMSLNHPHKVVQLFKSSQHNQFHIKITFAMKINTAQVQTFKQLQYIYRRLSFSWTALCGIFLILFVWQRCCCNYWRASTAYIEWRHTLYIEKCFKVLSV